MPVKIIHTEAGRAILIDHKIATLQEDGQGTSGSIALGILLTREGLPDVWCLFWEWGGDWNVFGDNERHDADSLHGWEPDAVREAIDNIGSSYGEDCEEDMEWFAEWADDAEAAINTKSEDED